MSGDEWCLDETMTLDYALQILGVNRGKSEIQNMVKAQSFGVSQWLATTYDTQLLESGKFVLKNWKKYQAACNEYRDKRFRVRRA
tara:strand:+ start:803 stop:1057 length:255 start_codon:yes stop_codon:yes gene_type:complete